MTAEDLYESIKAVKESTVIEVDGKFTLSMLLPDIRDGINISMLLFETKKECEDFIANYSPPLNS